MPRRKPPVIAANAISRRACAASRDRRASRRSAAASKSGRNGSGPAMANVLLFAMVNHASDVRRIPRCVTHSKDWYSSRPAVK